MADPKLEEWCKRARKLLKTAKAGQQNDAIKHLPKYLAKLESEDPAAYGRYKGEFEAVMQALDKLALAKNKDEKKFTDEADKLAFLKDKVRAAVALEKCALELSNLSPSDHPAVVKLQDRLDAAHGLLESNPSGAKFAVKDFSSLVKSAASSVQATEKLAVENRKAFPNMSQKRADMEALLVKLRTVYSGHQALEATLERALADTKVAAGRGDWVDVHTRIKDIVLLTDAECERISQSQTTEAGKTNPDVDRLNKAIAKLKLSLDATELVPYGEAFNKVMNPYLAATGQERVKAGQAVKAQADQLDKDAVTVARMSTDMSKLLVEFKGIKDDLDQNAPVTSTEAQAVRTRIQQFDTAVTGKRLFSAQRLSESLAADARQQHAGIESDRLVFIEASRSLDKLQKLAQTLQLTADRLSTGGLKRDIMAAVGLVDQKNFLAQVTQTRDWPALTARVKRAQLTLAQLSLREQDYQAFKTESDRLHNEQVRPVMQEIDRAIELLKAAHNKAGLDGEAAAKALADERVKAVDTWTERRSSATNENELQLPLALTALNTVLNKALEAAKPEGMLAHKNVLAARQEEAQFNNEWSAMALTLQDLSQLDIDAPAPLLAAITRFRETAQGTPDDPAAWKEALKRLRLEHGQARSVIERTNIAQLRQRQLITRAFNDATTALDELPAPLKKRFAVLVAALQTETQELRAMGEGTSAQACEQALDELRELKLRIDKLAATPLTPAPAIQTVAELKLGGLDDEAANAERDKQLLDAQTGATLGTVARDLDAFKLRLKTTAAEFGKDHPAGIKQIRQSLKVLENDVQGMQPNLATAELQELNTALDLAKSLFDKLKTERLAAADTIKALGLQVIELRKAGGYKDYVDSVANTLKAMIGQQKAAREPAAVSSLLRRADMLLKEVVDARAKPKGLEEKQNKLQAAELKQAQLEGEWIGHFPSNTAWEGRYLSQARDAIAQNNGDEGQIKEIRNIVKRAVKLHKEDDLVGAIRQIKLAEARVREVVADPMGPALGKRKALMDNARQFSADARELVSLLTQLPERAAERVPTLEPQVKSSIKAMADRASDRITPEALTGFALELDAANLDDNKLRELREQAMAQTRMLRELMTKHPLMVQLAQTPLNRAIPNVMRRLRQHVDRFEANVSRAVK